MAFHFLIPVAREHLEPCLQAPDFTPLHRVFEDPSQTHFVFCQPGRSTRGFEAHFEHGSWRLSLQVLASVADWRWALRLALALSQAPEDAVQIQVQPENRWLSAPELEALATPVWLQAHLTEGLDLLLATLWQSEEVLVLSGWAGHVCLGPEVLAILELEADTSPAEAYVVLVEYLSQLQMVLDREPYQPEAMDMGSELSEAHIQAGILPAELEFILDRSRYDALGLWPEAYAEPIWFPAARMAEFFGAYLQRLDEVKYLVKALPKSQIQAVIDDLLLLYQEPELPEDYAAVRSYFISEEEQEETATESEAENPPFGQI